jgi:hypothetical protein
MPVVIGTTPPFSLKLISLAYQLWYIIFSLTINQLLSTYQRQKPSAEQLRNGFGFILNELRKGESGETMFWNSLALLYMLDEQ